MKRGVQVEREQPLRNVRGRLTDEALAGRVARSRRCSPAWWAYATSYISTIALRSSSDSLDVDASELAAWATSIGFFVRT